jgi:hypothetical protein
VPTEEQQLLQASGDCVACHSIQNSLRSERQIAQAAFGLLGLGIRLATTADLSGGSGFWTSYAEGALVSFHPYFLEIGLPEANSHA